MKTIPKLLIALAVTLAAGFSYGAPLGPSFTYQGRLTEAGQPANGTYDIQSALFTDALGGGQVGPVLTNTTTVVSDGVFSIALDFGAGVFDGTAYWVELGVRPAGSVEAFTLLDPRQELTAAPYALYAAQSGTGNTPGNTLDQAYDQGGAGAGRTISANAGSVRIIGSGGLDVTGSVSSSGVSIAKNPNDNDPGLVVSRSTIPLLNIDFWTEFDGNTINSYSGNAQTFGGIGLALNDASSGAVLLAQGGGNVLLATGGGNVGIGTNTSPAAKLHISGEPGTDGIMFPDDTVQTTAAGGSASVPIGTVIDWWRPNDTFPIPDGYQICDGSVVNDPQSPFDGQTLPFLTTRFVMGAVSVDTIGDPGGQARHTHSMAAGTTDPAPVLTTGSPTSNFFVTPGPGVEVSLSDHKHGIAPHDHSLDALETDEVWHLPPYVQLLKLMRIR